MKTFGTLTLGGDRRNKRWVVTGSLPVMYLNRLVPDASILRSNMCNLSDNLTNVETLDWLMVRFPLVIDEDVLAYWYERVDEVNHSKKLRESLEVLEPANPSGQFIGTLREFQKLGLDFLLKTQGRALLADEMGLGKCIVGYTRLDTLHGQTTIEEVWRTGRVIQSNETEAWATLDDGQLTVQSFDGIKMVSRNVTKVYRQWIHEPIVSLTLEDGYCIECTMRHGFLTPFGWRMAGELSVGDKVAVPAKTLHEPVNNLTQTHSQGMNTAVLQSVVTNLESKVLHQLSSKFSALGAEGIRWCTIKFKELAAYAGYVYDLVVDQTHNYVANGILSHNTVMSLAYLATAEGVLPALVVAPLVVLPHWGREINKFLRISGRKPLVEFIRTGKREGLSDADIYVTNYDLLAKRGEDVRDRVRTVIFDEVQALRHSDTLRYRAAVELLGGSFVKQVMGLSGTPIHNTGAEIWPIANLIRPGMLGTYHEFVAQHCDVIWGKVQARNPQALYELLRQDFMLRRHKIDVLTELPPKLRIKEYIEADMDLYEREVSVILQKLDSKLATAKTEFEKTAFRQHVLTEERQVAAVCKLPYVVKWVRACLESEQPIIVYFHHLVVLDALRRYLGDWNPCIIVGGQSDWERDQEIQKFQEGKSLLLLAGIRAGGLGINLTASSLVIFAELDWTPAVHRQCLPPDTIISGDYLPISAYSTGQKVFELSDVGQVERVMNRNYAGELVTIKAMGSLPISLTPDHPVLTVRRLNAGRRKNSGAPLWSYPPPEWRPASTVRPTAKRAEGDYLIIPRCKGTDTTSYLDLTAFTNAHGRAVAEGMGVPTRIPLTREVAWMIGLYIAEGSLGNDVRFNLGAHEIELASRLCTTIRHLGYSPSITKTRNKQHVILSSILLARLLRHHCGHKANLKRIPDFILNHEDDKIAEACLRGYLAGDGWLTEKNTKFNSMQAAATVSQTLALQIQFLTARLGKPFLMWVDKQSKKRTIHGKTIKVQRPQYKLRRCVEPVTKPERIIVLSDKVLLPVRKVERTMYTGSVWNLQTTGHTYLANNFVVHNCEDRLHRIGQEKQVLAYYLVAQGTLDEKVAEVLVDKTEQISSVLGDVPEGENTEEALQALETLRQLPAFRKVPIPSVGEPVIRRPVEPHPALPPRDPLKLRKQY